MSVARFLTLLVPVAVGALIALGSTAQTVEVRVGPQAQDDEDSPHLPDAPTAWTVGDRIPVTIILTVPRTGPTPPEAAAIEWPWAPGATWGEAEVMTVFPAVGPLPMEGDPATVRYHQRLELAGFRPGEIPLPPVAIPLLPDGMVETPTEASLTVQATLEPPAEDPQPSGSRPLLALEWGAPFWWVNGALALLCLGLALGLLLRRQRAAVGGGIFGTDPLAVLEKILESLRTEPAAEPFHTRLSLALRGYLAARLTIPARESTTREITAETRRRLPPPVNARLSALLEECDGVKFSRRGADERGMAVRRQTAVETAKNVEEWWQRRRRSRPPQPGGGSSAGMTHG
jgi:hypothetical protein